MKNKRIDRFIDNHLYLFLTLGYAMIIGGLIIVGSSLK